MIRDWREWCFEECQRLRHEQIKEVFSKPKEERTEIEVSLINFWIEIYGEEI
jgi:hypothetical protein